MENNFIDKLLYFNNKKIQNKLITKSDIENVRKHRQLLTLCIFNNKVYLIHGNKGEPRHVDIINMLKKLLKKYKVPNLIANFLMKDTNVEHGVYFSHTNCIRDDRPLKLLIPGWSFYSYISGSKGEKEPYETCMNNIVNESYKYEWKNRIDKLVYRGHISTPHRYYIINELKKKYPKKILHILTESFQPEVLQKKPMSFKDLCKYKYQLLMNGYGSKIGNECGSIRAKYMLATGSICIYITLNTEAYEWWSINKEICPYLNICKNIDEAIKKIEYFENNTKETEIFLENQLKFVNTVLINGFEEYYYKMLCNYANRLNFSFKNPIGILI